MFRFRGDSIDVRGADELALRRWAREMGITVEELKKELYEMCVRIWNAKHHK